MNTSIGKGSTIDGKISCPEVSVAGTVHGDITAQLVIVRESGTVHGAIIAAEVHNYGIITGSVLAQQMTTYPAGFHQGSFQVSSRYHELQQEKQYHREE
ncbi:polymer-forming cytoskeletal protein [Candidatus Woesearchaeota archaeon]|nr:polymer-forming cytoskeletal protein [Candidatus Woesearchaeota archaeon]